MSRAAGQVDETKTEAILDAALALFGEKGALASMEAIARRAGVSRQTLYNRFPSKLEIGRALASRRSDAISAPLRAGGDPETVLTALAAGLLDKLCRVEAGAALRGVALMSPEMPDLADAIYQAGPAEGLRRLAAWLAEQDRLGLLSIPDPMAAAEMFSGMVLGHGHLRGVLGVAQPSFDLDQRAAEAARRFLRAFAR
ncbi:TetR/AcrR family transcriptional regulator [Brevundimonas sp.]|uniref:TetR/AcrR family transcriptional regulator n=1 Tax=Brevundimonas sp. TaxID=1871086 RepID=UPI00272FF905|nr:TetR/AcrR family transcriptional regulator [Brevundimonas sp.]MDP1912418.1 TetR/AcrR family transcriptional regulator [Brevundimonas sp.]